MLLTQHAVQRSRLALFASLLGSLGAAWTTVPIYNTITTPVIRLILLFHHRHVFTAAALVGEPSKEGLHLDGIRPRDAFRVLVALVAESLYKKP